MTDKPQEKSLFEKILENPETQKVLGEISKEDHAVLLEAIKKLTEETEKSIIKPLEQWKEVLERTKGTKP
jgi:hypothetical protein